MIAIKNIEGKDLDIPFEGWTYHFPQGKIVLVEMELRDHLIDLIPLAFDFNAQTSKKKGYQAVKRTKTTAYIKPSPYDEEKGTADMKIGKEGQFPTFGKGNPDLTPPAGTTDRDGVGWYGEGAVIEEGKGKVFN